MAEEIVNQNLGVTEPTPEASPAAAAVAPDATVAAPSTPDWQKSLEGISDEELEKHPRLADLTKRKGQGEANRILAKDRDEARRKVETETRREMEEKAWNDRWQAMSPSQQGDWLLNQRIAQEEQAKRIGGWWLEQSVSLKEAIPELKGKPIEEWEHYFREYPNSFGQTIAALVDTVVAERLGKQLEKEVPARVKAGVEAEVKERIGKTLATGNAPDLRSAPSGDSKGPRDIKWLQEMGITI